MKRKEIKEIRYNRNRYQRMAYEFLEEGDENRAYFYQQTADDLDTLADELSEKLRAQ